MNPAPPEPPGRGSSGRGSPGHGSPGHAPDPHPPLTPGDTQAERTRLSWRRTTLATTLAALLIGRLALHEGLDLASGVSLILTLAGWLAFIRLTHRRIQAMAHRAPAAVGRTLPAVAAGAVGLSAIGIALVLIGGVAG